MNLLLLLITQFDTMVTPMEHTERAVCGTYLDEN
jgi:hypothetical protein